MTSKQARQNANFLRNSFYSDNKWGIPFLYKQDVPPDGLTLLGFHNTKLNDPSHAERTIHFFMDDA